jgi:acetolactate decarboxylase
MKTIRKHISCVALLALILACGCATRAPRDTVFQTATIDSLLVGLYDGHMPLSELRRHGDFGIGTFHALDGEMLLLDGRFHQIRADGKVYSPDDSLTTPFATVCRFKPEISGEMGGGLDYESLQAEIDRLAPNQNLFVAVMLEGSFDFVHTRSVPAQSKPYPPLTAVAAKQPEFMLRDVEGVLLGFRSPPFVKGVNVPGYHLHFLSADGQSGGHVLGLKPKNGNCRLDVLDKFFLELPSASADFEKLDLSHDLSRDLKKVEQ